MQICPNPECKADNLDGAVFCSQCGEPLLGLLGRGTVLQNRYRIDDLLGCGGFGAVYKATNLPLGIIVAVKENRHPSDPKTFLTEAQILARLKHPNLPKVTDYFEERGRQYLVMEFIEGKDLDEVVLMKGRLDWQEALNLLKGVFDAVAYLHAQTPPIIHRDIKPLNIIITSKGQAVLVDFGIAKIGGAGVRTATGAKGYTPGFAPPEQFGSGRTDERSDIYALGATLYFCLTGKVPPPAPDLAAGKEKLVPVNQLNPSVPPSVALAIEKAMALNQDQRFQTVDEFWQALTVPLTPKPIPHRRPLPTEVKATLATLLIIAVGIGLWQWKIHVSSDKGMSISESESQPAVPPLKQKASSAVRSPKPVSQPLPAPSSPAPSAASPPSLLKPPTEFPKPKSSSKPRPSKSVKETIKPSVVTSKEAQSPTSMTPPKPPAVQKSLAPSLLPREQVQQLVREAKEAIRERKYEEAQQKLEQALALQPKDASLHYTLALVGMQQDDLELAQRHIKRAIELAPTNADYWAALGWLHLQQDEMEQAKQCFEKALSLDPQNARAKEGMKLLK